MQRAFAARMLAADPAADPVYFVDDHFVPYAGALPVAKGWNTKRRHAQPGRDDTLLVDARGRAVVFGSGEPTGLSTTLPGVLAQLRAVIGPHAPVLLGFDRGGAYPVTFTACRDAGAHWVTYRRAPLVQVSATPRRSWTVRDGKRITVVLADETIHLKGYGQARQLTLFEHDQPVLQVLTSDTHATGADLLCWLRSRWRIRGHLPLAGENMLELAYQSNGIDALADYQMDTGPDTRMVANPARVAARTQVKAAEAELAAVDRHAICTRRRRRRCGCGASCDARAGDMISATASGRKSRPSRSSRNPQAAAAPLPLLDASRLRCGSACPRQDRPLPRHGRVSHLSVASGPSLVRPIMCRLMSLVQRKLSTLLADGPDVIVCTFRGGQQPRRNARCRSY